jgi:predicted CXXCH cytochrome family protein
MVRYNSVYRILIIIIIVLSIQFLPISIFAYDFDDCDGCHDTTLKQDAQNPYLHSPFLEKQCVECHAADAKIDYSKEEGKIDWLSESAPVGNTHAFLFPDNELGEILIVDLIGTSGQLARHEFTVPSLKDIVEFEDTGFPPSISNVEVISINQGIFLTATVGWETDTLTDAVASYGEKSLSQESEKINRFGKQHQVVLRNLASDKTYRFKAISNDLFGRRQESEPLTFSTSIPSSAEKSDKINAQPSENNSNEIDVHFQRIGDDFVIEVFMNQAATIFLGTKGEKEPCLPEDEFHAGLSCIEVSSMDACLNCHNRHGHPLNVAPQKKGIIIPQEYPTFPDGRIICTSCHNPHSSKNSYLTRRDSSKVLCASCHRTWAK